MSASDFNFSPGLYPYYPSQGRHRNGYQVPTAGAIQRGAQDDQQGNWYDRHRLTIDSSSALLSSPFTLPLLSGHGHQGNNPPFNFGDNTTYSSNDGSNNHAYFIGGPSTSQETALGSQLARPIMNAEGYQENESRPAYFGGSYTDGSNIPGVYVINAQACGTNDTTYHFGGYDSHGSNAEAYSSTSQVTFASSVAGLQGFGGETGAHNMPVYKPPPQSQLIAEASTATLQLSRKNSTFPRIHATRGSTGFEQGHGDLPYGPIPHASIQSSNSMCFRTERRTIGHRSAPYSIMYRQERSRGPVYNGNIYGGVNYSMSNVEGAILQYLKEHAATGAMHDSDERFPPPLCHPGTREAVIHRVLQWYGYQEGPDKPIMWVHAPAGYGKTAVAGTVAATLDAKLIELDFNPLGATFFFWRTSSERNSPARFIITLAYQLSLSIPELAPHVENAVRRNPMILTKALEVQMAKLLVEPFKALGDTKDMPNRLIIIDGLDECINSDRESRVEKKYAEDQEVVQVRILDLIRVLASHKLPLSCLILSRPEAWIKQHIRSRSFADLVETADLYKVGDHMNDVETFVRAELTRLGVGEDLVKRLVQKACGHMLFASTVIRHIDCPYDEPCQRLHNILNDHSSSNPDLAHSTPFSSLHELYKQILRSCPEGSRSVMIEVLEDITGAAPFNASEVDMNRAISTLDSLSGRVPGVGMKAIRGLQAVLALAGAGNSNDDYMDDEFYPLEFFIHSSFREFLLDPRFSLEFYIDPQKGRRRLLSACLHYMSSITLDRNLDEDHIQYAVMAWTYLWDDWVYNYSEQEPPGKAVLLDMFQKLLSIDLTACFVHAFTQDPEKNISYWGTLDTRVISAGVRNLMIPRNTDGFTLFDSEPFAQQAVSHVRTSYKAAVLHLLQKQYAPDTNNSHYFPFAVSHCLQEFSLAIPSGERWNWNSNRIIQALKTLRRESWKHFDRLMESVKLHVRSSIHKWNLYEGNELLGRLETLISFIQEDE
ncbi:hypothetical protein EST38_g13039 [Candolleomyces aberdarensis]|uniref:Nephrocystin 3-like N-terminal domain-containing protein n=1 Tax=Candolleomyces aberdarensis TaxID=2316362 RepID=A0A4Q2D3X0_9AGAR|nr:hypothetical protein EST38_g13039 [Candolleomyces aberdarensis]